MIFVARNTCSVTPHLHKHAPTERTSEMLLLGIPSCFLLHNMYTYISGTTRRAHRTRVGDTILHALPRPLNGVDLSRSRARALSLARPQCFLTASSTLSRRARRAMPAVLRGDSSGAFWRSSLLQSRHPALQSYPDAPPCLAGACARIPSLHSAERARRLAC